MIERLGKVIYWLASGAAILWVALFFYAATTQRVPEWNVMLPIAFIGGIVIWGIGLAVRYVLCGPHRFIPLKRRAKMWRESFVAGATNTGNVTATVGNKLVLNWHGTPTQRDGALKMFPVIRDKRMPGVELGNFADVVIANIHDEGMSPDDFESNVQIIAMLWRVFTTRLDDGGTYGDLIGHANIHAAFELHEQINDQFKITWKISVMRGRTP